MIPESHPRYRSLITREKLANFTREGVISLEGLTSHGRGEAFDYLLGEVTSASALNAEKIAAALILSASHPVISVNGNAAALAAGEIAKLQKASGAIVEVNLFHRTEARVKAVTALLEKSGINVLSGPVERFIPLDHDRGLCHHDGIHKADVIFVPLEDGDRAEVLVSLGKKVIAVDLNPLSRTTRAATLPIIDELTRALPNITKFCESLTPVECKSLTENIDSFGFIRDATRCIQERLSDVLD